jgi:hypothetical protein
MSFLGRFGKSKKAQPTQPEPHSPSDSRTRSQTLSATSPSSFRERLNRPRAKTFKTSPQDVFEKQLEVPFLYPSPVRSASPQPSAGPNTALNAFKTALLALGSASDGLPAPGFKFVVDTLLIVMENVQVSYEHIKFLETAKF